jgi:hypothetical protein
MNKSQNVPTAVIPLTTATVATEQQSRLPEEAQTRTPHPAGTRSPLA